MSDPIYTLEGVTKSYGSRQVLAVDHLTINRGEILTLVGPSGAGKTTLLRLLNFLEQPTAGAITFDSQRVSDKTSLAAMPLNERRRVTAVFQNPGLLDRSVAANVRFGLGLRGEKLSDTDLEGWLERLGLAHLAKQSARKLSAGESQRAAIARALVIRPDVLLLDEPTTNLDPYNVGLIERIVREEQANSGVTVLLVTHDVFQAKRMSHRAGLILNGTLVEVAEAGQFFNSPQESQTAAFLRGELVY